MRLQRIWESRGPLALLLWPLSQLYARLSAARRLAYRAGWLHSQRLAVPVIVVGNVVAGGAGKTPVVIALVQHLQARGLQVGVISRGYGRRSRQGLEVQPDSDPHDVGDEPLLIRRATGAVVAVDAQRVAAAQRLLAAHPGLQVLVSDDGLQHLALQRDLELCVFDDRGIGNGWLLPAGPLREPWPRPCDAVLHTGERPAFAGFRSHRHLAEHAVGVDGRQLLLSQLGQTGAVIALAAIAQPERFFAMLRDQGVALAQCIGLPDHYDFDSWKRPPGERYTLICTEKDAAKLWRVAPDALAIPLRSTLAPELLAFIDARLSSLHGHQAA